ncbi:MAG: CvpA family protein [Oscillospiraceae bacterium]|nr:CvpA family protein [Oscillospiraceae bacterium]
MTVLLDIIAVVIIACSVLYGLRKGLILTVAGIVITIVSIGAAWGIASAFSPPLSEALEKNLAPAVDEVIRAAALPDITAAEEAFESLGFTGSGNNVLTSAVTRKINETGQTFRQAALSAVCGAIAFSGLFIFGFLFIRAGLEFAAHFVSKLFKLPGLNLINKIGGAGAGLIHGVILLFIIGWGLQFAGTWISGEEIEQTVLMKSFTGASLLDWLNESLAKKL